MPDCGFLEFGLDEYMSQIRKAAYERKLPFKGVFELTPRCNFNCNMCYVHLKPDEIPSVGRELSAGEWISIAEELQRAGMIELTLTGGEPFVRRDFREIYEAVHDMGFLIQIFSNGYLLDEEMISWLVKRPPRVMRFTLYGASDESYQSVCGIPDGFTRVKRSVELLREAGIPLYLAATVTKENESDLEGIYRYAEQNRLPIIHTSSLINPVRGASADAKSHEIERQLPPTEVIRQIRAQSRGKFPRKPCTDFLKVCGNYRTGFCLTWNGMLQLCAFLSEPAVPVQPGRFMECWEQLLGRLELLRQPEECRSCKYEQYCERCPGLLYAENGGCDRISEGFCRKAEYNYLLYGKPLDN